MPEMETAGYRRYWPMRQHLGKERLPDGTRVTHTAEVYRDMVTGEVHAPVSSDGEALGWNGSPPDLPTGSKEREGCERVDLDAYRRNYERIDWEAHWTEDQGTEVEYAIAPSSRLEHGQRVGYDIFRISGHGRVGETVYLTLTYDQWVRTIDQVTVSPVEGEEDMEKPVRPAKEKVIKSQTNSGGTIKEPKKT